MPAGRTVLAISTPSIFLTFLVGVQAKHCSFLIRLVQTCVARSVEKLQPAAAKEEAARLLAPRIQSEINTILIFSLVTFTNFLNGELPSNQHCC
jgi:hypothetical protein